MKSESCDKGRLLHRHILCVLNFSYTFPHAVIRITVSHDFVSPTTQGVQLEAPPPHLDPEYHSLVALAPHTPTLSSTPANLGYVCMSMVPACGVDMYIAKAVAQGVVWIPGWWTRLRIGM
jgi:hypothetical protein